MTTKPDERDDLDAFFAVLRRALLMVVSWIDHRSKRRKLTIGDD